MYSITKLFNQTTKHKSTQYLEVVSLAVALILHESWEVEEVRDWFWLAV